MSENVDDTTIARYFLGDLSDAEMTRIEIAYFQDRDFFERILAEEKKLISRYLANEMSEQERGSFEEHFLHSPQRREMLQRARSPKSGNAGRPDRKPSQRSNWWRSMITLFRRE